MADRSAGASVAGLSRLQRGHEPGCDDSSFSLPRLGTSADSQTHHRSWHLRMVRAIPVHPESAPFACHPGLSLMRWLCPSVTCAPFPLPTRETPYSCAAQNRAFRCTTAHRPTLLQLILLRQARSNRAPVPSTLANTLALRPPASSTGSVFAAAKPSRRGSRRIGANLAPPAAGAQQGKTRPLVHCFEGVTATAVISATAAPWPHAPARLGS